MHDYAMPVQGLLGGIIIGLAAAIMLLGAGRIAGVSGMVARASGISGEGAPRIVAAAFVIGLPLGALLVTVVDWRLIFGVIGLVTWAAAAHVGWWLRDVLRSPASAEPVADAVPGPEPTPLDPGSTVTPT